jgi:polyisoprenoid-binding protein YceI
LAGQSNTHEIAPAPGGRFALEVFKSKLWEGRKHTFVFERYRGVLSVDHEHPERSTVQFVVESASPKCTDDWVKPQQIKDIERAALDTMAALMFPELSFRSSRIIVKSSDQYDVEGLLTIRDRTKQVALSLRGAPREGEFWVEGSGRVKLSDFGLKPPKAVFGVGIFIGTQDEMNVVFRLLAK